MSTSPHNETLARLIEQTGELYTLPSVALEVLRLTDQPDVDARQLKECIENDPALTSKLLRVVNSSLFGLSREVSDLNQALALLGIKPLKLLVLGFSLPEDLFQSVQRGLLAHYWQHALTKAVAARELATLLGSTAGDEAFLAGLLQDIGMLALVGRVGESYVRFVDRAREDAGRLCELERLALGFDHVELSVALLERWGMPSTLLDAVRGEDTGSVPDAPRSRDGMLRRIVELADLLTQIVASGQTALWPELIDHAERLGLSTGAVGQLIEDLEQKVRDLAGVLRVDLPDHESYRDVVAQAHRRLVEEATTAAVQMAVAQRHADLAAEESSRDLLAAVSRLVGNDHVVSTPTSALLDSSAGLSGSVAVATAPEGTGFVATTDATTLAATHPNLVARIAQQVAACRRERTGLSMLLVELDRFDDLVFRLGPEGSETVRQLVGQLCAGLDHTSVICEEAGEARFAVLLPDCERYEAVRFGKELLRQVTELGGQLAGSQPAVTLSVGAASVAMPPKNFPPADLLDASSRCLYGAQVSGGNTVKSIEIY